MAHFEQIRFFEAAKKSLMPDKSNISVLEIGSHNVNGGLRALFPDSNYLGVDLSPGDNVDLVYDGINFDFLEGRTFDLIISAECFEHNPYYKENLRDLKKHLNKGGFFIISTATTGRLEHGTSRTDLAMSPGTADAGWNYYGNISKNDLKKALLFYDYRIIFLKSDHWFNDLYCVASASDLDPQRSDSLKEDLLSDMHKISCDDLKELYSMDLKPQPKKCIFTALRYIFPRVIGESYYQSLYLLLKKLR